MYIDFYSLEGATLHQNVYDLHRRLWWKAVVEAFDMRTRREQNPRSVPHAPTQAAKGRIHSSHLPVVTASA